MTCKKGIPFDKRLGYILQQAFGLSGRIITRMVVTCEPNKPVIVTYDEAIDQSRELAVYESIKSISKGQGNVGT